MSRSVRHTPVFGVTAGGFNRGEKDDKRRANRTYRRRVKASLGAEQELPLLREVSDTWGFAKDGKHWRAAAGPKDMRK